MPVGPLYVARVRAWPAIYFWLALQNRLGADPVKALEHEYGLIALQLLIAALVVTPLRDADAGSTCCGSGGCSG